MREFFKFNFERYEEQKTPTLGTLGDNIIDFKKRIKKNVDGTLLTNNSKKQQTNNIIYLNKLDNRL
jgi:hypothetical protein